MDLDTNDTTEDTGAQAGQDELTALRAQHEALQTEHATARTAYAAAIAALRDSHRAAHPSLPAELIDGSTVEELGASVGRAVDIAAKILAAAANGHQPAPRVPAGGTPATTDLSTMSPHARVSYELARRRAAN